MAVAADIQGQRWPALQKLLLICPRCSIGDPRDAPMHREPVREPRFLLLGQLDLFSRCSKRMQIKPIDQDGYQRPPQRRRGNWAVAVVAQTLAQSPEASRSI